MMATITAATAKKAANVDQLDIVAPPAERSLSCQRTSIFANRDGLSAPRRAKFCAAWSTASISEESAQPPRIIRFSKIDDTRRLCQRYLLIARAAHSPHGGRETKTDRSTHRRHYLRPARCQRIADKIATVPPPEVFADLMHKQRRKARPRSPPEPVPSRSRTSERMERSDMRESSPAFRFAPCGLQTYAFPGLPSQ